MNTEDRSADHDKQTAENIASSSTEEGIRILEKRLAELRAQGILIGGDGRRETLRTVAHVPGALERFLKARD